MTIIHLLIPLSILMAGGFLWAFFWAVRSGQFDDTCTPSMRILTDEATARNPTRSKSSENLKPKEEN
jgi:cbb3-type cytochrome oxidase maturation protein